MPIRALPLFSLLLGAMPVAQAAQKHCLPYGPTEVTLSGTLERSPAAAQGAGTPAARTGEAAGHDDVLLLPSRLCVAPTADGRMPGHDEVRRLRLALDAEQAAHLREEGAGRIVRVTGTLSPAEVVAGSPALVLTVVGVDSD